MRQVLEAETMTETYIIDGNRFASLSEFYEEISQSINPNTGWGHNLDAFNDILRGGFGTPDDGFDIVWKNSSVSKLKLGYEETIRVLQKRLTTCHSSNRKHVMDELEKARQSQGPTVFDWVVEVILDHGEGGQEAEDNVRLILD
jgi:RNAse (barnase) inhibitor barstar